MNWKNLLAAAVITTFMAISSNAAEPSQDAVDKAELQKFQGSWVMADAEMDGKKVQEKHVKKSRITFTGNKVQLTTPHQHRKKIVAIMTKLDPSKKPGEMQWVRNTGPNKGKTMTAIYEFEGPDQYKVSFDSSMKETPKQFGTKAGSGHIWHTWKRVKK